MRNRTTIWREREEKREREREIEIMEISKLPEECIAHIISLTSPRDACRSSLVSPRFRSVADSDVVWEKFLPSDYKDLISRSVAAETTLISMAKNKKALYLHLCENPIPIDDGNIVL